MRNWETQTKGNRPLGYTW